MTATPPDPPPGPAVVSLHLWGVPGRHVPTAVARMALHRRPVRALPGVRFAKLLGTGSAVTFTPRDARTSTNRPENPLGRRQSPSIDVSFSSTVWRICSSFFSKVDQLSGTLQVAIMATFVVVAGR